jgi:D-proline reductase (dithiol) PrdB
MPRLDRLPEIQRNSLGTSPVPVNEGAPYTHLKKPLPECRLAIVTTAAIHLRGDVPFDNGDSSFRVIPTTAKSEDIVQSHTSIGFDRTATYRDLNIVFPRDRVNELVERGELGSVGANAYSFLGAHRDASRIATQSAPVVARLLLDEGVDVVLITPT